MYKIEVYLLKGVNGILFGSSRCDVRKILGVKFKEYPEKRVQSLKEKKEGDEILKRIARMAGKSVDEFLKNIPSVQERTYDDYQFCQVDYDDKLSFEAFSLFSKLNVTLNVDGIDCSDFTVKTFLSLSNDFMWNQIDTSWISYKKQISLYCPKDKNTIESVIFGCPGYYVEEE